MLTMPEIYNALTYLIFWIETVNQNLGNFFSNLQAGDCDTAEFHSEYDFLGS